MNETAGKRILIITPFAPPNIGGAETHLKDIYGYLAQNGYRVTLLTYQPLTTDTSGAPLEIAGNLIIHRYSLFGKGWFNRLENYHPVFNFSYLTPLLFFRSFIFMIRHHQEVDVIHVFGLAAAFIARFLKIFFRKPIIMSTETIYNFNLSSLFAIVSRWVLGGFDLILAGSLDSKKDIVRVGVPEGKVSVYTHWINLDIFKPGEKQALKETLGWEPKFTALFVGRLIRQKGIRLFLESARQCRKEINFKIIGDDGPELPEVKKAAKEITNLEFLGRVPNEAMPSFFAAADVFVYPALYDEDLARVLIEAMACGTPVINTNKGSGIYELNDKVAFVTPPTKEAILEKIEYLFDHPDISKSMSTAAVVFAQKFGPVLGKPIIEAYNKVLAPKE